MVVLQGDGDDLIDRAQSALSLKLETAFREGTFDTKDWANESLPV